MRPFSPLFTGAGNLLDSIGIVDSTRVAALVGAGGKTSLMYSLAQEIVHNGKKVVTSTTTKICAPDIEESPSLILLKDDPELVDLPDRLRKFGQVTVGAAIDGSTGKLTGIEPHTIERCLKFADHVIVEADGSARRCIKAPEAWEPVIPSNADLVICVVGLDCIGEPVSPKSVFRMERFIEITGLAEDEIITPSAVARLLVHPDGGLKGVPPSAEFVVFLNKKDLVDSQEAVNDTVKIILDFGRQRIRNVVVGQLRRTESSFSGIRCNHI